MSSTALNEFDSYCTFPTLECFVHSFWKNPTQKGNARFLYRFKMDKKNTKLDIFSVPRNDTEKNFSVNGKDMHITGTHGFQKMSFKTVHAQKSGRLLFVGGE